MEKDNNGIPNFVIVSGSPDWDDSKDNEKIDETNYRGGAAAQNPGAQNYGSQNFETRNYGAANRESQSNYGAASRESQSNYGAANTADSGNTKKFFNNKIIAIILVVLLSAGAGFGGGYLASNTAGTGGGGGNITINPDDNLSTTEAVAEKALPSVVGITSKKTSVVNDFIFGQQEQESEGVGTGIIVDESGYILTNSHVVMDGDVDAITVLLSDGREVEGSVLWNDSSLDLAIVKIKADNLKAAELGDSDDVNIGSYAAAIGNPLGLQFASSVTQGVVSGLDRTITASSSSDGSNATKMEGLMQVDAAINSGNSGGPLLNSQGQVIGINTAKASGEGMGFAIPINTAKPIIEKVKETGEFSRVYMGVTVTDLEDMIAEYSYMDFGTDKGAFVQSVSSGSPAEAAGLQAKDIIVEADGEAIESGGDLISLLLNYSAGDEIEVKYIRDGKEQTVKVKLTGTVQE